MKNISISSFLQSAIISSIFRGMGDSKSPMYFIAVVCVANIGLDYLFMGVMHFGSAGVTLGTTISQAVSVAVSLLVILKRKSIVLERQNFKPKRVVMGKILKIGVPIDFQNGIRKNDKRYKKPLPDLLQQRFWLYIYSLFHTNHHT